jgi:hypothetical protein
MSAYPQLHHLDRPATVEAARAVMDKVAVKADGGKPDLSMILTYLPMEALVEIAKVMEFGAKKYSLDNWRKGFAWMRIMGSLLRHLYAWARGEDLDPETGLSHIAHAGCNILFLLTFILTKTGTDDRIKGEAF